jgi:cysteine sulfinate desulfinase/cysteine desulfurase-like protein
VLLAIGRSAAEAQSSLRLTLGRSTTEYDTAKLTGILPGIVSRLREL